MSKSHKEWTIEKYILKYFLNDQVPLCECGCGNPVSWHKMQYKFNDFITGHNHRWSKENQPTFTKEQIDFRNEKIKEAYQRDEPKIKISKSLREKF